jgi:hypothetical protein
LGDAWDTLPEPIRRGHSPGTHRGRIVVTHHSRLAPLFGFPPKGEMPIELRITVEKHQEKHEQRWVRHFGDFEMTTTQYEARGKLAERRGPIEMRFDLVVEDGALVYRQIPSLLGPRVKARAWAENDRMGVKVEIAAPVFGDLVTYAGMLVV